MTKKEYDKIVNSLITANNNFRVIAKKLKFIDFQLIILELVILLIIILKLI